MTQPPVPPEQPGEFSDFFHTDELPTGPVERHSHRGPRANGPLGRRALAPLIAVVVVVAVILLLIWINGKPAGNGPGPGVISAPVVTRTSLPTPTTTPSVINRPTPTATPSIINRPTPAKTPSVINRPNPSGAASDRAAMAPVAVLNNSTISGLASHVAAEVKAKGWTVRSVGNLQGVIPVTTVFFPAGEKAAAKHLKREFGSIARVAPNSAAHLTARHLTLVVTRDWSG